MPNSILLLSSKVYFEVLILNQNVYIAKYILYKGTLDHFPPCFFVRHENKTRWIMLESNSPKELPKELILVLLVVGLDGSQTGRFFCCILFCFPRIFCKLANFLNLFCNEKWLSFKKLLENPPFF